MSVHMASMPRILLAGDAIPESLTHALERGGFPLTSTTTSGIPLDQLRSMQLVILEVSGATVNSAQGLCRRWRIELGDQHVPILWLCSEISPGFFAAGLDAGADICVDRNCLPDLLVAQIRALLRVQNLNTRLLYRAGESTQINQRLQSAYQQIDSDLELTRRIHRGFLPRNFPEVAKTRFSVCYRPRSRIGGDFYDALRLDEENVSFYVADAMGRGLPASSLLSIFVKKCIQPKEINGRSYRLVPPSEILARINRDLLQLNLPEPPFVTMLYVQMNCRDGSLSFARAAHPAPLYIPVEGDPQYWHCPGTLLGVFESEFPDQTRQLRSGDKLLLFTDGVHPPGGNGPGTASDPLTELASRYRDLPIQTFVDQIAREMLEQSRHQEDFTLLGLEYH